jgi:hypothetical protein
MSTALKLVALVTVGALALGASLATAGTSTAAKGQLTITTLGTLNAFGGPATGTFTLLGSNAAMSDNGKAAFTAPRDAPEKRTPEGLTYLAMQWRHTLKGKAGNLVVRVVLKRFAVVNVDDYIATGTWTIASGTGRYSKLKGGGALVGIIKAAANATNISDYDYSFRLSGAVPGA